MPLALTTRLALTLLLALAVLGATRAEARPLAELAPSTACGGHTSGERTQDALICFVNWARRAHGLAPVHSSDVLERAAADKAAAIVRCGEFSHEPCGIPSTTSVKQAGYRYRQWGGNALHVRGPSGGASPGCQGVARIASASGRAADADVPRSGRRTRPAR